MIAYYWVTRRHLRFSRALRVLSSIVVFVLCLRPVLARVKAPFFVVLLGSILVRLMAISEALVFIGLFSLLKFLSVSDTALAASSF